mgnify:CR=1 FL=1
MECNILICDIFGSYGNWKKGIKKITYKLMRQAVDKMFFCIDFKLAREPT